LRAAGKKVPDAKKVARLQDRRLLSIKEYAGLSGTITIDPDGITRSLDVRAVEFGIDGAVRSL